MLAKMLNRMSEDTARIEGRVDSLHIKFDAVIKELSEWKMTHIERIARIEMDVDQNKKDIHSAHDRIRVCCDEIKPLIAGDIKMSALKWIIGILASIALAGGGLAGWSTILR